MVDPDPAWQGDPQPIAGPVMSLLGLELQDDRGQANRG